MTDLTHWTARNLPSAEPIEGRGVTIEPMVDEARFGELFAAFEGNDRLWDYLAYGPFETPDAFAHFGHSIYLGNDPLFHAIVPHGSGVAEGVAALMRLDPANGVGEIGHICLAPSLQMTRAATEAFYLLFRRLFDELGYRRLEWKCNDANAPSKRAAERLGFRYEGLFRQHMVVKGHNRDTAWYAILDGEWPLVRAGFERWLDDANFGADGRQRRSLADCRARP